MPRKNKLEKRRGWPEASPWGKFNGTVHWSMALWGKRKGCIVSLGSSAERAKGAWHYGANHYGVSHYGGLTYPRVSVGHSLGEENKSYFKPLLGPEFLPKVKAINALSNYWSN